MLSFLGISSSDYGNGGAKSNSIYSRQHKSASCLQQLLFASCAVISHSWCGDMQQPRPTSCSSCQSTGDVECKWCAGTGFFILGNNMLCEVPSKNTRCVICSGKGFASCADCKGTGFRAKWLEEPPINKWIVEVNHTINFTILQWAWQLYVPLSSKFPMFVIDGMVIMLWSCWFSGWGETLLSLV